VNYNNGMSVHDLVKYFRDRTSFYVDWIGDVGEEKISFSCRGTGFSVVLDVPREQEGKRLIGQVRE